MAIPRLAIAALLAGALGACGRSPPAGPTAQEAPMSITVTSPAFAPGAPIPRRFTGDGEDVSPPLEWAGVPEQAKQLALICDDPDAPRSEPWVHWIIYGLPAQTSALGEGIAGRESLSDPAGALHGLNSWGAVGYRGPAPPEGHGTHHYHFTVYALDAPLKLAPKADKRALLRAMEGHILATGELIGTYAR